MRFETKAKRWGSSLGIILPKSIVEKQRIKEKDKVSVEIKNGHLVKEFFGIARGWKKSTQQIKDEMQAGWKD